MSKENYFDKGAGWRKSCLWYTPKWAKYRGINHYYI